MRVWLINIGEPLPTDPGVERLLRTGLLAGTLAAMGHDVMWWTSTFDHNRKVLRHTTDTKVDFKDRLTLYLLHAPPYKRNISWQRWWNHRQLARQFRRLAVREAKPDVILCGIPTVELAAAAADFATHAGVPLVVDVRDQHPDIYETLVPAPFRRLARLVLFPMYRDLRRALDVSRAVVAISPSILEWALRHARRGRSEADRVVPLGYPKIDVFSGSEAVAAESLVRLGVDPQKHTVWYIGSFSRWIDLETPIAAARKLTSDGIGNVQFVFSGRGDYDLKWRSLAQGLPNVVFTGWVDLPKIGYLRKIAWVGLAPYRSTFNALGNKIFEYMAGGLPILLSIEGDAKAVVEKHDCGLVYEPNSPASLSSAIKTLLADPDLRDRFARNSRAAFDACYDAAKVYKEMAMLLLAVANKRS